MNSRRLVGPRVLLHRRRPVRRRYRCQVPALMRCGWRSLSRPAARDLWSGVMRFRANELGVSPECFFLTGTTRLIGSVRSGRRMCPNSTLHKASSITCSSQTQTSPVWRCQVEPKSDLFGDRTGELMDAEKVVKGRLTELEHMNDHHVCDWIDEADIPKGTKIETSRWCDGLKRRRDQCPKSCCRAAVQGYQTR